MATFHGPSGYGKSVSAAYGSNKFKSFNITVRSVWTKKKLTQSICQEMGLQGKGTVADMIDEIIVELSKSQKPLIIDEADYLVSQGMIEVIRDIHDGGEAAIILIGEEMLPAKLKKWERVHGRMLDWVAAQPASYDDTVQLSRHYCKGIKLEPALLERLHDASAGSVRRICVNLDQVRHLAETEKRESISLAEWGKRDFFTGNPPSRRAA
jgi:DNA transposition AAA+ family ATPase